MIGLENADCADEVFVRRWIGSCWLRLLGWRLEPGPELPRKFVFIAAPHTSNWDLVHMIAAAWALRIRISWMGKHTLFAKPVFGRLMRWLGGVSVKRGSSTDTVSRIADLFRSSSDLILAIAPEGTRSRVETWRSGFYHIARESGVPVGLGFLDYGRRRCGIGGLVDVTDDIRADMDAIREFYRDIRGRYPHLESPPLLREERLEAVGVGS